jgi:hypothetical protein
VPGPDRSGVSGREEYHYLKGRHNVRVTSVRPSGNGMGSSNWRDHVLSDWRACPRPLTSGDLLGDLFPLLLARVTGHRAPARRAGWFTLAGPSFAEARDGRRADKALKLTRVG